MFEPLFWSKNYLDFGVKFKLDDINIYGKINPVNCKKKMYAKNYICHLFYIKRIQIKFSPSCFWIPTYFTTTYCIFYVHNIFILCIMYFKVLSIVVLHIVVLYCVVLYLLVLYVKVLCFVGMCFVLLGNIQTAIHIKLLNMYGWTM